MEASWHGGGEKMGALCCLGDRGGSGRSGGVSSWVGLEEKPAHRGA